jgi:hypothetical protein
LSAANPGGFTFGQKFRFTRSGFIVGARYFRDLSDSDSHFAFIHTVADPAWLSVTRFRKRVAGVAGPGSWEHAYFRPRIAIVIGTVYELDVFFPGAPNYQDNGALAAADLTVGNIVVPRDSAPSPNGLFSVGGNLTPASADGGNRYGIDVLFYER